MINRYSVTVPVVATVTLEVLADDPTEAAEQAGHVLGESRAALALLSEAATTVLEPVQGIVLGVDAGTAVEADLEEYIVGQIPHHLDADDLRAAMDAAADGSDSLHPRGDE